MPHPDIDPQRVADLIATIGREEVMARFADLQDYEIREKGPGDLVTVADEASEARLIDGLVGLLPNSVVVGEEGAAEDPSIVARIGESDAPVWIIDPVDGTANYARGVECFAVIVALTQGGETIMGWIHDPVQAVTAMAVRGGGAFVDDRPIRVADPAPLAEMTGIYRSSSLGADRRGDLARLDKRLARRYILGSSGIEYMGLGAGAAHIMIDAKLKPWDHAAGVLIHAEAGGYSACLDGQPYRPTHRDSPLVLAPDEGAWHTVMAVLNEAGK